MQPHIQPTAGQATALLTKSDLAKKMKVTERSIDNWAKRGLIRKIKIGASCRFDWNDVLADLKSQEVKS
ncbi:MAG: hypothetical protein ACI8W8_003374 [Rhodothermales bacterium]|jgi:hypothetical protein